MHEAPAMNTEPTYRRRISRRLPAIGGVVAAVLLLTAPATMASSSAILVAAPGLATDTPTPLVLPTDTPTPPPLPTDTPFVLPTDTPTPPPLPTDTPTPPPLPTDTPTPPPTPVPTPTPTPFQFPTPTPFQFPTPQPFQSPTPPPFPTQTPFLPTDTPPPFPTRTPGLVPTPTPVPIPVPRSVTVGTATTVTLEVPTGSVLGKAVTVVAVLKDASGNPLGGQHLSLFLEGQEIRSDKTDNNGQISFVILGNKFLQARQYSLGVLFSGTHGLAGSTATDTLTILSAAIQIQTVPPLPNLRYTLGSLSAVTGPDGVAALPVPKSGTYQLTADLNADTSPTATVRASFVRWLDNVFTANRTINVTGPATYSMGLKVAYRAHIKYVDLDNQPVDPSLVDQAQFSTGTGEGDVVINSQTGVNDVWWSAATTIRAGQQLIPSPITYRAISIKIHGAESVNRGQQSWTPTQDGTWTIQLLLYKMTVQTHDAIFGSPVSGQIQLTYPDGYVVSRPVGGDGQVTFDSLPRGQYQLHLNSSAFTPPTPVALSKPQDATLRVITFMDIGLGAGLILLILGFLAVVGRFYLFKAWLRRSAARIPSSS